jgi:predicted CxxxxCH...CXXCH cytochrome family protein
MSHRLGWSTATLVAVALSTCGDPRKVALSGGEGECTACHGDATRAPTATNPALAAAPPLDLAGESSTISPGVGAHQVHLLGGAISAGIACTECHSVPANLSGHPSGTLSLTWGSLATSDGAAPAWTGSSVTCSNVYCHGATLNANGSNTSPTWTKVDGTQAACGTCHAIPPPPSSGHPQRNDCGSCHTGYSNTTVNLDSHINGTVDLNGLVCSDCHGDATRAATVANPDLAAAPPVDTLGNRATTAVGVGAHQAHLSDGPLRAALPCSECHAVPANLDDHPNGFVNMTWGTLATSSGAAPSWNLAGATCSNTYCHGATLDAGGSNSVPNWTVVDGSQAACGTCHGLPPPASSGHPQNGDCGGCHSGYTTSSVNLTTHLNGSVDVLGQTCTSCHGNRTQSATPTNPLYAAPPVDASGESATTAVGVGAHQTHVNAGALSAAIACSECHAVPDDLTSHPNGAVNLTFGPLAASAGAQPSWNPASASCSNYCHGVTLGAGGTNTSPAWTSVDGTQDACGTCHGLPPPASTGHPEATSCGACHPGYTQSSVNVATHIDGAVEVTQNCTACHGDATRTATPTDPLYAAPPVDLAGDSATTFLGVGAHQSHLNAGTLSGAIPCTECHLIPSSVASHPTGALNVTFGSLAGANNASPSWDPTTGTCSGVYCHGATFNTGGSTTAPIWNLVDGTQASCGTCHGIPPFPSSGHPQNTDCGGCHPGYTSTTVNLSLHINGSVDVDY